MKKWLGIVLSVALIMGSISNPIYAGEITEVQETAVEDTADGEVNGEVDIDIDEDIQEDGEVSLEENVEEEEEAEIVPQAEDDFTLQDTLESAGSLADADADMANWTKSSAIIHLHCPDTTKITKYYLHYHNLTREITKETVINVTGPDMEINLAKIDPMIYYSELKRFSWVQVAMCPWFAGEDENPTWYEDSVFWPYSDDLCREYEFVDSLPDGAEVCESRDEALAAIREAHRTRETMKDNGYTVYLSSSLFDPSEPLMDIIFDRYDEREGMRPDEGDYMALCSGGRDGVVWSGTNYVFESNAIVKVNGMKHMLDKITFETSFITTAAEEQKVDEKVAGLLAEGGALHSVNNSATSNEDKARAAYNWITAHVSPSGGDRKEAIKHTAYNAFINGNATCQGYALAYARLLRELGVSNKVIMGTDANAHTYNIVLMEDGNGEKYYYYSDTSQGIFKSDYNSFSRTTEQVHFTTPKFVINYTSKIKGYKKGNAVAEVLDKDGNVKFTAGSLIEARAYIVDCIDKLKETYGSEYDIPEDEIFTVKLLKNLTGVSKGELDFSSFADSDSGIMSDYHFTTWDYSRFVKLDLNGFTLSLKSSFQYLIRTVGITNGTIKVGSSGWLFLLGADSEHKCECTNVNFVGLNKSEELDLLNYVSIDNTCTISSFVYGYANGEVSVAPDINVKEMSILNPYEIVLNNLSANTLDVGGIGEDSLPSVPIYANSITVNSKLIIDKTCQIRVKDSLTIKGTTNCYKSVYYGMSPVKTYGCLQVELIKTDKNGVPNIAKLNLNGNFDNQYREMDIYGQYTSELEAKPIDVSIIEIGENGELSTPKIPVNAVLGSISKMTAYITDDTEIKKVTVDNNNISKVINLNPGKQASEYQTTESQNLDISGTTLSYADRLPGEVAPGSSEANFSIAYIKDGEEYYRYYPTIEKAVEGINTVDATISDAQLECNYSIEIIQKKTDVTINELPSLNNNKTYSLSIVGNGVKSVYLKDTATYPVTVDITPAAKSYVYIVNAYNQDDTEALTLCGNTSVCVQNDNNTVYSLSMKDNSKIVINNPLTIKVLSAEDNASALLGDSKVGKTKIFGSLTLGSITGDLSLVDTLMANYRISNLGDKVLQVSGEEDYNKVHYSSTTAYGQHLQYAGLEGIMYVYSVVPAVSKLICKNVTNLSMANDKNDKYSGIMQEIATVMDYSYSLQSPEVGSTDELQITSSDTSYINADIDTVNKKIKITANVLPAKEKAAEITVRNVVTDKEVLKFYVTTTNPSWVNKTPVSSVAAATDIDFVLNVAAPKGMALTDYYYFGIKLNPAASDSFAPDHYVINTKEEFVSAKNLNKTLISAFVSETNPNNKLTTYGQGIASKMNAEIAIYLTNDGAAPKADESNVVAKTAQKSIKKLDNISTQRPYCADKISLKKAITAVYPGQIGIKVADVSFDKKITFITSDYWETYVENPGNSVITARQGGGNGDTGIYVDITENAPSGKYVVVARTKYGDYDANTSASITINVPNYIKNLKATVGNSNPSVDMGVVYKNKNKAASVKPVITAEGPTDVIKNPKVTYEVKKSDGSEISNNLVTVDKNGKISIASCCNEGEFKLIVKANDFAENETVAEAPFKVTSESVECAEIKLLTTPEYDESNVINDTEISADTIVYVAALDKDGHLIDKNLYTATMTAGFTKTTPGKFIKTGKVTYTIKTVSGQKMTKQITVKNADNSYYELGVTTEFDNTPVSFDSITKEADLSNEEISPGEIYVAKLTYGSTQAVDTATDVFIDIKGAKILSNNKKQLIRFVLTSPKATITVTRGSGRVPEQYAIKNNNLNKAAAPKATVSGKLYGDYKYADIKLTVKPVEGCTKVRFSECQSDLSADANIFDKPNVEYNPAGVITIPLKEGHVFATGKKYTLALDYYDDNNHILTKNSSIVTLKPVKYPHSYKLTPSYNLKVGESVKLKGSGAGACGPVIFKNLYNCNEKGTYNDFNSLFTIDQDGILRLADNYDESEIRDEKGKLRTINGYVSYTVKFESGNTEEKTEKIKVTLK